MISPHLDLAKKYWEVLLKPEDLAIDATCGNGYDTLFLAGLCSVIGLDIQEQALANTEALLAKHQKEVSLHLLSHAAIDTLLLPFPPRLIVYNLGYLPRGDKAITTKVLSTLESVDKGLKLLAPEGALSITCYPGHEEGAKEEKVLEEWAMQLPPNEWSVRHHKWASRSPSLLWISKA